MNNALQVVAVRYHGTRFLGEESYELESYRREDLYSASGWPVSYAEPRLPDGAPQNDEIARLGLLNGAIADQVAQARKEGQAVLLAGGNCHHATGVLGGLQDAHGAAARIGLVWFDAHGDFNTAQTTRSGMLGGMPVAVCAGLTHPVWREGAHISAPLPTDRLVMGDLRSLDPAESQLLQAVGVRPVAMRAGAPGPALADAVADLAARVDWIYLHIDVDILDFSLVPYHNTGEPGGLDLEQAQRAVETVLATRKVAALGLVSVYTTGGPDVLDIRSGSALLQSSLRAWSRFGHI
jgi:arginase